MLNWATLSGWQALFLVDLTRRLNMLSKNLKRKDGCRKCMNTWNHLLWNVWLFDKQISDSNAAHTQLLEIICNFPTSPTYGTIGKYVTDHWFHNLASTFNISNAFSVDVE